MKLHQAQLSFNDAGTPQSDAFGDVYFSNDDGMAESDYVFIQANNLHHRWQAWPHEHFCIGETGFGTGLNFLLTVLRFAEFKQQYPHAMLQRLHFISVEKFPIAHADLAVVLKKWPNLKDYANVLLSQYPPEMEGVHRCNFLNNSVSLDLVLGDAQQALGEVHCPLDGLVNAWFLDGFMPSKNEQMWSSEVYQQMARLSASDASLATFTAAGAVKRGLQAAGFTVDKIKGFGRKREMITAKFSGHIANKDAEQINISTSSLNTSRFTDIQAPYFQRLQTNSAFAPKEVCIVGAGIAGVLTALRLVQQGIKVRIVCKDAHAAMGASGNPVGGFYPQLNAQAGVNSRFYVHAFLYAKRFYDELLSQGIRFEHDWCGVLQLGFNENTQTRLRKMQDKNLWPDSLAKVLSSAEASDIAGIDIPYSALYLPQAGWVAPPSLIAACIQHMQSTGLLEVLYEHELVSYERPEQSTKGTSLRLNIRKTSGDSITLDTGCLIIAAGHHIYLGQAPLPMRLTRGQVEAIEPSANTTNLKTVLCHKGYFTPAVDGFHALGSTYIKNDTSIEHRLNELEQNLNMHKQAMQEADWAKDLDEINTNDVKGRAAIRCSTPDHLPMLGAMPDIQKQSQTLQHLYKALPVHRYPLADNVDGVYLIGGLGSRGITSAPILVDTLVAQILNRPLPLQNSLLNAISPNRFLVRSLIRQTEYLA